MTPIQTTLSIAIIFIGTTTMADSITVAGPNGSNVKIPGVDCPTGMNCVSAETFNLHRYAADTVVLVPDWLSIPNEETPIADAQSSYIKGISDKSTVDICNYCNCCEIRTDPDVDDFIPWGGAETLTPFDANGAWQP